MRSVFRVLLVLWAGSMWSLAAWTTPILFHLMSDRHFAGVLAGNYFSVEAYLGIAVSVLALLLPTRSRFLYGFFAAALLVLNEWGVRHLMGVARAHGSIWGLSFGAWHGVSTVLYGAACLAVLLLIWKEDLG